MSLDRSILKNADITRIANATAAGTTDINGTVIDMQGYKAALCIAALGALTATQVTRLIAEQSDNSNGSPDAFNTIAQTALAADADGNKLLVLEVFEPSKRYVRFTLDRGTANAVLDSMVVIRFRANTVPVTQGSTVSQSATSAYPAES